MKRILSREGQVIWLLGLCILGVALQPSTWHGTALAETASSATAGPRILLIEAEDLGMAHSIDKASFEALEKGWVTSAGFLAPAPWFPEVVRWAHSHPNADLGSQLDLNAEWASYRWRSVSVQSEKSGLLDPVGYLPSDARYIGQHAKPEEVAAEFQAQIDLARKAGLPISHIDSHGGIVLYTPWLFQEYWKVSAQNALPAVLSKEYVYQRGTPAGQNIFSFGGAMIDISSLPIDRIIQMEPGIAQKDWLSAYERTLAALSPGTYLLSVHLGYNDDELQAMTTDHPSWGAQWRQNDLDAISSPQFREFLKDQGFILVSWKDLQKKTVKPN